MRLYKANMIRDITLTGQPSIPSPYNPHNM